MFVTSLGSAYAQSKQTNCERDVEVKLGEMFSIASAAGSVTYKKMTERAMLCIQSGRCTKPYILVRLQEIMVDEKVIEIQRKKLALIKQFADRSGPTKSACEVAQLLPKLIEELNTLNAQQFSFFEGVTFEQ